jgi:hypothetical protein
MWLCSLLSVPSPDLATQGDQGLAAIDRAMLVSWARRGPSAGALQQPDQ